LLLICGVRVLYRVLGQGMFHCQRCGGDRRYRHRCGRHWFTVFFFVPVIPLASTGEHVQCAECGTAYRMEVLRLPTVAQMEAALPAGMRAAAAMVLRAGGSVSPAARHRAVEAVRGAGEPGYDHAALARDLGPTAPGAAALDALAAQLEGPAREWFLAAVVRIGLTDGELSGARREAVCAVACQLGMTPARACRVIDLTEHNTRA
jgi:hypothetical protein